MNKPLWYLSDKYLYIYAICKNTHSADKKLPYIDSHFYTVSHDNRHNCMYGVESRRDDWYIEIVFDNRYILEHLYVHSKGRDITLLTPILKKQFDDSLTDHPVMSFLYKSNRCLGETEIEEKIINSINLKLLEDKL